MHHDEQERYRLEAENQRLRNQVDALLDVKRAAQALVDFIHYQQNASSSTTWSGLYTNLIDALNTWYNPNGTAYRER